MPWKLCVSVSQTSVTNLDGLVEEVDLVSAGADIIHFDEVLGFLEQILYPLNQYHKDHY